MITEDIRQQLINHYQLETWHLHDFGAGDNNRVSLLNDSYIVRVSHTPKKTFGNECDSLVHLHDLPLKIPGPIWHSADKTVMCYPKIEGKQFDHHRFIGLSDLQQKIIADRIADFLADLHPRMHDRLIAKAGLPMYDKSWIFADNLRTSSYPNALGPWVDHLLNVYQVFCEKNPSISQFGLLHNDLYHENILMTDEYDIAAIIDRGDITIGDIHLDFLYLYHPDHRLMDMVCDRYEHVRGISLDRQYIFLCLQIFVTKMYGVNPAIIPRSTQAIHQWMNEVAV